MSRASKTEARAIRARNRRRMARQGERARFGPDKPHRAGHVARRARRQAIKERRRKEREGTLGTVS